jgi:hypothetical protein
MRLCPIASGTVAPCFSARARCSRALMCKRPMSFRGDGQVISFQEARARLRP